MTWQSLFADAAIVASVSTAIFAVIDFLKKVIFKRWQNRIPGEVWFGLSLAMAVGVGVAVYWDDFFGSGATLSSGLAAAAYSLVAGAGSKLINAVSGAAGAKLKAAKEEARLSQNRQAPAQNMSDSQTGNTDSQYGNTHEPEEPMITGTAVLTTENSAWPTAVLLEEIPAVEGKRYWIALDPPEGRLYPLR